MTDCTACLAGRHFACDTTAWDEYCDPVECACWFDDHGEALDDSDADADLDVDVHETGRAEDRYLRWLFGGDR